MLLESKTLSVIERCTKQIHDNKSESCQQIGYVQPLKELIILQNIQDYSKDSFTYKDNGATTLIAFVANGCLQLLTLATWTQVILL